MLPYLCGGVVMNDPFALSLIFVVPLLSVYLVIKLIFTYIALSIDNHILLKVNVDAFKYKQKLTKCFLFGFSSDLLSLIITMLVSNFKALDYINMMFFAGGNVEYLLGIVISYFFTFIIFFYFVFYNDDITKKYSLKLSALTSLVVSAFYVWLPLFLA